MKGLLLDMCHLIFKGVPKIKQSVNFDPFGHISLRSVQAVLTFYFAPASLLIPSHSPSLSTQHAIFSLISALCYSITFFQWVAYGSVCDGAMGVPIPLQVNQSWLLPGSLPGLFDVFQTSSVSLFHCNFTDECAVGLFFLALAVARALSTKVVKSLSFMLSDSLVELYLRWL